MPSCIAKRIFRFSKGPPIPTNWSSGRPSWAIGPWPSPIGNSLAGVVRPTWPPKEAGLKLLIGAEITPHDAAGLVLLATDRPGYGRLSRLHHARATRAPKGECRLQLADVADHAEGLLACVH